MDKKVKLSLNKTMVSRLQNNEQNSIWGETAPATWWILRKPRLSINCSGDMVDSTEAPVVHQSVMR